MRCIAAMLILTALLAGCNRGEKKPPHEDMFELTLRVEADAPGVTVELYCDRGVAASGVTRMSKVSHDKDAGSAGYQTIYAADLSTPINRGSHILKVKAVGYAEWERPLEVVGDHHFEVKLIRSR